MDRDRGRIRGGARAGVRGAAPRHWWDYRHQVLGTKHLRPWQVIMLVKLMELIVSTRPRVVWRLLFDRDRARRRAYRWCVRNSSRVWLDEIHGFVFRSPQRAGLGTLLRFWGPPIAHEATLLPRKGGTTPFHKIGDRGRALDRAR